MTERAYIQDRKDETDRRFSAHLCARENTARERAG